MAAVAAASIGLAGCTGDSQGANPDEARQRLQATVPSIAESLTQSMTYWDENQTLGSLSESVGTLQASFERMFPSLTLGDDELIVEPLAMLLPAEGDEEDIGADIEVMAALIFSDENHEGDGIYRIRGAAFCEDLDGGVDAECAAAIDDLELRIRATKAGDGLDLGLRIGPDQAEPLVLELRTDRASVVVDLADAKDAIAFLSEGSEDSVELPRVMEGTIALSLLVPAKDAAEIQVSVREALRFEAAIADSDEVMAFSTEARDPLYSVRMDKDSYGMSIDVGRTEVSGPWGDIQGDGNDLGLLEIDWRGLSYEIDLSAGSDSLLVRNIGLGDGTSTVKLAGETLVAVDINADSGRRFDLELTSDSAGLPLLTVDPGLDLQVSYDLAPLADGGVAVDAPLLKAGYSFTLSGERPSVQPVEADALGGFPGGMRVVEGELVISADGADEDVVVPAGQCLVEVTPEEDAHPLTGALAAVDCP